MTDLDELRAAWAERDLALTAALQANAGLTQAVFAEQKFDRVRRAGAMTGPGLVFWIAILVALGAFIAHNWGDWRYVAPAAVIDVWTLVMGVVTLREREALRAVDFGQPPLMIQEELAHQRLQRARTVQWAFLTGQIVWWIPLALVMVKGLVGVDLYASAFMRSFIAINLLCGVLFIPLALLTAKLVGPMLVGTRFSRGFVDVITGRDLAEAQAIADRVAAFR